MTTRSGARVGSRPGAGGKRAVLAGQATNLTHVLVVLTRLRQLCDHQALCLPEQHTDAALQNPLEVLLSAPGATPTTPAGAGAATPIKPEEKATNSEVRRVARALGPPRALAAMLTRTGPLCCVRRRASS